MRRRLSLCCLAVFLFAACPGSNPAPKDDAGTHPLSDAGSQPVDSGTPDAGVTVTPITVTGHVTHYIYGQPYSGVTVTLGGHDVTTDANGTFTFTQVTPPYDLSVKLNESTYAVEHRFLGLTRPDPTVETSDYAPLPTKSTTVSGTLSGVTFPLPANTYIKVLAASANGGTISTTLNPGAASGAYSFNVDWLGDTTVQKNLYAVEYTLESAAPNLPTAWGGYGKISPVLTSGTPATGKDIVLGAPDSSGNVNLTLTAPVTPNSLTAVFGIAFEPAATLEFSASVTGSVFANMPSINGVLSIYADYVAGFTGPTSTSIAHAEDVVPGETVHLNTGPGLTLTPATGATYSPGMTFSWNALGGISTFQFYDAGNHRFLILHTTANSVTLPSGFTPASGTASWLAIAYPELHSVDDFLVPRGYSQAQSQVYTPSATLTIP